MIKDSPLATVDRGVQALWAYCVERSDGADSRFTHVYVLDTCALMEQPDILRGFAANELAIVSKRVIDELDVVLRVHPHLLAVDAFGALGGAVGGIPPAQGLNGPARCRRPWRSSRVRVVRVGK